MSDQKVKGTVSLFCCGGTGVNIGSKFLDQHLKDTGSFAQIGVYFIDTSKSNLISNIPSNQVFIYKNERGNELDGNGHLRNSENYKYLSEPSNIANILEQFKPGNLNIIVHSAAGGTGSVVGPLLAKELISRGENVIVMMLGVTVSRLDVTNTLKTIKTYENISTKIDNPIIVLYRENNKEQTRFKTDEEIERYITLLAGFFSGTNHGLDTADLHNFLHYNLVTNHKSRMVALDLFRNNIDVPKDCFPISAVTLTNDSEEVDHGLLIDYQASGIINKDIGLKIKDYLPLHMVTFVGYFNSIINRLNDIVSKYEANDKLISNRSIVSNNDNSNNDGLIL